MIGRYWMLAAVTSGVLAAAAWGQERPAATPAGALGGAVEKEVKGLTSDDFPEREAALKRLQGLVADQLKQRAAIQEVISALQNDLARQQGILAVVSEEEAQAQIAGLLEMERGLAGWTEQTMSEPLERRKLLLEWGLSKDNALLLARVYAQSKRTRLDGIKQLAKMTDDNGSASWTLARLINDRDTAVRAAAMAAAWTRKPTTDIVNALWYRAVSGSMTHENGPGLPRHEGDDAAGALKVDFPGGDPMEFEDEDESAEFIDSQIASDVLVHFNSPIVGEKIKALVEERGKTGKDLSMGEDPDWTLVAHRLVETYNVKNAIPILAQEALGTETEQMGGDMNGRPFTWSRRTVAIGTLAKLIGKDPADFELIRARDMGDPRGWMWACDVDQQMLMQGNMNDGAAVRAFYAFWKDHHAEYGVKETPSNVGVPPLPVPGRAGRGRGGKPMPVDPPVILPPPGPNVKMPLKDEAAPEDLPVTDGPPKADAPDAPVEAPRPLPMIRGRG